MDTEPLPMPGPRAQRVAPLFRYPIYGLADSVLAAKAVHEKGGGVTTNDHLAAYLGYKSAHNGAFVNRVAAAKLFGLIDGPPSRIVITPLAQKILMPINATDSRDGLVEAFLRVPLYKAVYDEYHGKELPPEFGLKNALRSMFGVTVQRTDSAYRALIDSAETAGFFEVRGSRTQLIMPSTQAPTRPGAPPADEPDSENPDAANGGGGGGGGSRPPISRSAEDLRGEYVATLIGLLRDKGANGEVDVELMTRIEKLLGLLE